MHVGAAPLAEHWRLHLPYAPSSKKARTVAIKRARSRKVPIVAVGCQFSVIPFSLTT
ncbi:hypothetical protein HAALTHF_30790n [Vreelandella aquamarina]|nr:hypothetical protein HAALTHF_30790n [Halomonas axialensis]